MKVLALYSDHSSIELVCEMAWQYSCQVARNQKIVFLEVEKSKQIFSMKEIVYGLKEQAEKLHLPLALAWGHGPAQAWAFLRHRVAKNDHLPLEALEIFLDPFQRIDIPPLFFEMLAAFKHLGYRDFADLHRIPQDGLPSRFGRWARYALQQVQEDALRAWPLWRPTEKIQENQIFDPDQRIQNIESLAFVMRPLLERLMQRLIWRHEALTSLKIHLSLENFSVVKEPLRAWDFSFSFPQTQAHSVFSVIKEKLDFDLQRKPLESPVVDIEIFATEKSPLPDRQKDFFSKKEENQEIEASLISRLHQKLGKDRAFRAVPKATYHPEKSWQCQQDITFSQGPIPLPLRPLILFRQSKPLRKLGPYLLLDHQRYRILDWQGPERLSTDWWTEGIQRQYWTVSCSAFNDSIQKWWIYTDFARTPSESLFLHGVFD